MNPPRAPTTGRVATGSAAVEWAGSAPGAASLYALVDDELPRREDEDGGENAR
jgi:hypothetical protein